MSKVKRENIGVSVGLRVRNVPIGHTYEVTEMHPGWVRMRRVVDGVMTSEAIDVGLVDGDKLFAHYWEGDSK